MSKPVSEIKKEYEAAAGIDPNTSAPEEQLRSFIREYVEDTRSGVCSLVSRAEKLLGKLLAERERVELLCAFEKQYPECALICGIDEVGRGPLAGPVVAGAVILPKDCRILYINDSKKLSEKKREELYDVIRERALDAQVGIVGPDRIDEINILQATYEAMRQAIGKLKHRPELLLNDAVTIPKVSIPQVPIIRGDAKSISIGAASIFAKVTRDRMMVEYDEQYPEYGFASNKGYGSAAHIEAIRTYGPTPIHRRSFLGGIYEYSAGKAE